MPTPRTTLSRLSSSRTALAVGAAAVLVLMSGCSSSGESGDDSGGGSASSAVAGDSSDSGASGGAAAAPVADTNALQTQQVISTGNVQLRSDDVGQSIFDVRTLVDEYAGQVADDDTETDPDGRPLRSRMTLRIPTADFDEAMDRLASVATLVSSSRQSADVTNEVVDNDVRVEAQRRSIDRIQVLFDNATSIKDVVSIESELSRRQADLASLEAQQRYLADQTSLSTITLAIEQTPAKAKDDDTDKTGFLAGLRGGWQALTYFLVAVATVGGAVLPWLLALVLLGVPTSMVIRKLRRRAPAAT